MATLARETHTKETIVSVDTAEDGKGLSATIPSPFPQEARERLLREAANQSPFVSNDEGAMKPMESSENEENGREEEHQEILPSIASIQHSCITALVDLFAPTLIVAGPSHLQGSSSSQTALTGTVRLRELVRHLQESSSHDEMVQVPSGETETELLRELPKLVAQQSDIMNPEDAILAQTLISLLAHFDRLATINGVHGSQVINGTKSETHPSIEPPASGDLFDTLRRQVNDLQVERLNTLEEFRPGSPPVFAVESTLLWSRIDQDLEDVLAICRQRTDTASFAVPPEYDEEGLPQYEHDGIVRRSIDTKSILSHTTATLTETNEKMRMDLEAVTSAIDRLYVVLPQLHNQRVELKDPKRRELEKARAAARSEVDEVKELEKIIGLLGKASERKLVDQAVVIDSKEMEARMQRARRREMDKRRSFNEHLAEYSGSGRLHGQDAELRPEREKDPEALLSLPEFIREPMPSVLKNKPTNASEPSSPPTSSQKSVGKRKSFHRLSSRSRSLSSPTMNWLLPSTSRSSTPVPDPLKSPTVAKAKKKSKRPSSSGGQLSPPATPEAIWTPEIAYVAEFHENLRQVRAFVTIIGVPTAAPVEAAVDEEELDVVHLHCGSAFVDLRLPVKAASPGYLNVQWTGTYYEFKTPTAEEPPSDPFSDDAESKRDMLGAPRLMSALPSSFTCASCSLPLVQASKITDYRDLPSEHWAELVDAWMCHSDQKLNEQVAKHAHGFEPESGKALVGGSYILFNVQNVVTGNLVDYEQSKRMEDWYTIRCICGSIVGRRRDVTLDDSSKSTTYRLAKYSIRPLSSTMHIPPVPLTTFVVEDMIELQQAHASYRFIILDEEEERPRLLIWLFKPTLRLAYVSPTQYQIPKTGAISCAKILFQILGPSVSPNELDLILAKHPGFPQAEHLLYPIHVCRRIAGMLRESSTAYPEGLRTMTGLDVGWLPK